MKTIFLRRALPILVIVAGLAFPVTARGEATHINSLNIDVSGAGDPEIWVGAEEQIVITWSWVACSRDLAQSFPRALNENSHSLDGQPLFDSLRGTRRFWRSPDSVNDLDLACIQGNDQWEVVWSYSLGTLTPGDHRLQSSAGLERAITNGMDSNGDGRPDRFSGRLFDTEVVLHVVEGGALIREARQEGTLNVIALPDNWCNYGSVMAGFTAKYGIPVNSVNPSGSSADELQAIRDGIENPTQDTPDVIDVGPGFALQAKEEGLIASYRVATWNTIPAAMKDADAYWYGDYYGLMAIAVNPAFSAVPAGWDDLIAGVGVAPTALGGDPLVSSMAFFAVYSAALANGGSLDDIRPGLSFFGDLNAAGRLSPGNEATLISGETPVLLEWTYLALAQRDANPDVALGIVVPPDGQVAGIYTQAVSAYAPHPNAARLWMEYLYSDEGQLGWLNGYCFPARYEDLLSRGVVPQDLLARLPDISEAVFPSVDQIANATTVVEEEWVCTVYGGCP